MQDSVTYGEWVGGADFFPHAPIKQQGQPAVIKGKSLPHCALFSSLDKMGRGREVGQSRLDQVISSVS